MTEEPIVLNNIQRYLFFDDYYNEIKKDIKNIDFSLFLNSFCRIDQNNHVVIDYRYFKLIAFFDNYELFKMFIVDKINKVLSVVEKVVLHVNLDNISLVEIDKHSTFLMNLAKFMAETFPDKLENGYIYNSGFLVHSVYNMLIVVLDKETRSRIVFVNK
jgi:hypothetical protein